MMLPFSSPAKIFNNISNMIATQGTNHDTYMSVIKDVDISRMLEVFNEKPITRVTFDIYTDRNW
jgi:hypothetical protein